MGTTFTFLSASSDGFLMGRLKDNVSYLLIREEGDELSSPACLQTITRVLRPLVS